MIAAARATIEDLARIVEEQEAFWGEREMDHLHHSMFVHEFGSTSVLLREEAGTVLAYLFGFVTLERRVAYAHLVAVRASHRGRGLGRRLYEEFEALAREREAIAIKAYTRPENVASIAFHRALGMTATETPGYAGPGETRVVFWRDLR